MTYTTSWRIKNIRGKYENKLWNRTKIYFNQVSKCIFKLLISKYVFIFKCS